MNRLALVSLALLFPLALAAQDKKEEKGEKFSSKDGKFSVTLPGKPSEKTQKVKTPNGEVEVHLFLIDMKDRAYIVSYNDYVAGMVDPDAQKVLTSVVEGNAKGVNGKVVSDEKTTLGKKKHPGRDIRIELPDKKSIYRAKVFLVGNRLYQVVALGPDEFVKSKAVEEALKSFAVDE